MNIFFEKIELLRKKKAIRINKLCNKLNISKTTYWRWKNNLTSMDKGSLLNIAEILNINVNEISDLSLPGNSNYDIRKSIEACDEFKSRERGTTYTHVDNAIFHLQQAKKKIESTKLIVTGLLESINFPLYIKDSSLKYVMANRAFLNHFSLKPYYIVKGKNDDDFFPKVESKFNSKQDRSVLHSGKALDCVEQFIPGTKKKQIGTIYKFPILDSENKVMGVAGLFLKELRTLKNQTTEPVSSPITININSLSGEVLIEDKISKSTLFSNTEQSSDSVLEYFCNLENNKKNNVYIEPKAIDKIISFGINEGKRIFRYKKTAENILWIEKSTTKFEHNKVEYEINIFKNISSNKTEKAVAIKYY